MAAPDTDVLPGAGVAVTTVGAVVGVAVALAALLLRCLIITPAIMATIRMARISGKTQRYRLRQMAGAKLQARSG